MGSGLALIDLADFPPSKIMSDMSLISLDGIVPKVSFFAIIGGAAHYFLGVGISASIDFLEISCSMKCFRPLEDDKLCYLLFNCDDFSSFDYCLIFI